MVAVNCNPEEIWKVLADEYSIDDVSIACVNSPNDCVLAASLTQLEYLVTRCKERGIKTKRLDIDFGFHSPVMDNIKPKLDLFVSKIRLGDP